MKEIKIGLLGLGTVGSGTYSVLLRNQAEIRRRAGRGIEVAMACVRNLERARALVGPGLALTTDPWQVVRHPDIEIVVEVIGGIHPAKELILAAIASGKHVVTANKALLAEHGNEIFDAAHQKGVMVAFEGAVAVSIPIIKALREGLSGNRIEWVAGIINGTTNFILSEMRDKGVDFNTALKDAQRLGYAEADPSFDIDGFDAAHKVTILSAIAFGIPLQYQSKHVEGIANLHAVDIAYAQQMGYRIKLLGITKMRAAGVELRVHPTLVPQKCLMANVEGSMNGIMVKSDAAGITMYYGAGAGSETTGSAVIADLVDVTRLHTADPQNRVPHLAFQPDALSNLPVLPMADVVTSYYLRLQVADQAGVLAKVTGILAEMGISIDAVLQREARQGNINADVSQTDVVILTHDTSEGAMNIALERMQVLPTVLAPITRIRKEELN